MKTIAIAILVLIVCALITETIGSIRKSTMKSTVSYKLANSTVRKPYKKSEESRSKLRSKEIHKPFALRNEVTQPTFTNSKVSTIAEPPLEGYEEPATNTGKDRSGSVMEVADDYVPFEEHDFTVPGDIHDNIIEKSFGFDEGREEMVKLTSVHKINEERENVKPLKIIILPPNIPRHEPVTEGDADFKVLRKPLLTPESVTHSPSDVYDEETNGMKGEHSKMLNDNIPSSYRKRDYIVQQRIHKSNDKDIQARKEFALLQLVRNQNYKITQARPVYKETVFMESFEKPDNKFSNIIIAGQDEGELDLYKKEEGTGLVKKYVYEKQENPAHIVITGKQNRNIELYKTNDDQNYAHNGVDSGGIGYHLDVGKSFGRSRQKPTHQITEQVYLPNQLSPRGRSTKTTYRLTNRHKSQQKIGFPRNGLELKTTYCEELPSGNYPNPGLVADVDTRCSYITCSNKHTFLFYCPQGSWNGEIPGTYHGGEASSTIMTWKRGEVFYVGPSNSNVFCHVNNKKAVEICNQPVPIKH